MRWPARQQRGLLSRFSTVSIVVDCFMLGIAAVSAQIGADAAGISPTPIVWLVVYPVLVLALFAIRGLYRARVRRPILDDLRSVAATTAIAVVVVISIRALLYDDPDLTGQAIRQWLFAAVYAGAGRASLLLVQRKAWSSGQWVRPTLIVGAGSVGQLVAKRLREHPECGLEPIGFLDKEPLLAAYNGLPVLGASWDLEKAVAEHDVRHVIVTFSTAPHHVLLSIVNRCDDMGVTVSLVPRLFETITERLTVEHLGGLPLFTVQRADPKGWQFGVKYVLDRVFASAALLLTLPIVAAAALAVRLSMGSPVFYRQRRIGLDGRTFEIVKFRSMRPPPEDLPTHENGETYVDDDADRLTPVGSFLRKTSVDELPQLFNVLRGDMSLIGPRPERPELAQIFERHVYRYGDRHRVKSGITGWAQVHGIGRGRDRFSHDTLGDRVEWDNYYIENWSVWLDVKIVLMTIAAILHFRQA